MISNGLGEMEDKFPPALPLSHSHSCHLSLRANDFNDLQLLSSSRAANLVQFVQKRKTEANKLGPSKASLSRRRRRSH